jgi:subtilisin-like proprotein convertase family protein/V8-like Glu-specific endopeptidase
LPARAGVAPVEPPKTNSAAPLTDLDLSTNPYIFNGMVTTEAGQGSGVVAENPKLFFTAAHVLYDPMEGWSEPPLWVGGGEHVALPPEVLSGESRGYFRWSSYAGNVQSAGQNSTGAFATDLALAWGLEPFFGGTPAAIDFNGYKKLKKHNDLSMITGFPATLDYTEESGNGLLHATKPEFTIFQAEANRYLYATHISTGPGNSGGPVWLQEAGGTWDTAGILISGRPSEAGIYAFTPSIKSLLKAASPLVGDVRKSVKNATKGVSTSTGRYVMPKPKKIPDGLHRWTKIPVNVQRFEPDNEVFEVFVDLTITTNHRGDLMVGLMSPNGTMTMLHDGQGATEDDLVLDDFDASEAFSGEVAEEGNGGPNGTWFLLVQDRLTSDQCVVTRFELEIRTNDLGVGGGVGP